MSLSTKAHTHYRHAWRESKETQVLSKKSHIPAGNPTFIWEPFIRLICSFKLTWNNFGSRLTCSDSHASAETRLIPSQHGITYGINGSHYRVSIYLPGLRVTRADAIISPVRVLYFFLCQLRALGTSQMSLDEIRFYHFWKRLFSFAVTLFFRECSYSPKRTIAWIDKLEMIFLECNYKKSAQLPCTRYERLQQIDHLEKRNKHESHWQSIRMVNEIISITIHAMTHFLLKDGPDSYE